MNRLRNGIAAGFIVFLVVLLVSPTGVHAHEKEDFVDWDIGFTQIRFNGPDGVQGTGDEAPRFIANGVTTVGEGDPTISLATGDRLIVTFSFTFIGPIDHRGDLFWITRLGLDFATLGRYVNGEWFGGGRLDRRMSFLLEPDTQYDVTLVLRSIQPVRRHLHVGVSISDIGNIPAAPSDDATVAQVFAGTLEGGPVLYGVFTEATGPVVEPLDGIDVGGVEPFSPGTVKLLETWPWATAGVIAQIVIGLAFIAIMYWYGKRLAGGG